MKTLTNFRVNIYLNNGKTVSKNVLAINEILAIRKVFAKNFSIQPDVSQYKAEAPLIGLIPH